MMNSRAFQFQLQAAEAAAAPVHATDEDETGPPIPTPMQLELVAQATGDASPAPGQGRSGVAPASVGNAEVVKCPECSKSFTSDKAMFGHLRKHPERGYKGATRPATATSAAAAVAGDKKRRKHAVAHKETDVSAMNMTVAAATTAGEKEAELSTKWPVAAKRGHAAFAPTEEDEEAAMILLEMASSSRSTTSETQHESVQQQVHAAPDAVSVQQTQQDVVQVQPMLLDHVAGHQITLEAEKIVHPPEIVVELSAESQTTPAVNKELTNLEITTEAVLIVVPANKKPIAPSPGAKKLATRKRPAPQLDLEQIAAVAASPAPPDDGGKPAVAMRRIPSPASNKKHECPICGKSFPTYQALGGHMSSHSKGKTTAGAWHDDLAVAQAAMHNILARRYQQSVVTGASTGLGGVRWGQDVHLQDVSPPVPTVAAPVAAQSAAAPASPAPHVCTECQMTFPSGQALGGHKRKHWFPEKYQAKAAAAEVAAAPAVAEAAPAEIAAPVLATVAREFDLNELPHDEGEGESNQP